MHGPLDVYPILSGTDRNGTGTFVILLKFGIVIGADENISSVKYFVGVIPEGDLLINVNNPISIPHEY